jgi:hypothetical protein
MATPLTQAPESFLPLVQQDFSEDRSALSWLKEISKRRGGALTQGVVLSELFSRWVDSLPEDTRFKKKYAYITKSRSAANQATVLQVLTAFQKKGHELPAAERIRYMTDVLNRVGRSQSLTQTMYGEEPDPTEVKSFRARRKNYAVRFQDYQKQHSDLPQSAQLEGFLGVMVDELLGLELAPLGRDPSPAEGRAIETRVAAQLQRIREALSRPTRLSVSGETTLGDDEDEATLFDRIGGTSDAEMTPELRAKLNASRVIADIQANYTSRAREDRSFVDSLATAQEDPFEKTIGLPRFWLVYLRALLAGNKNHETAYKMACKSLRAQVRDPKAPCPTEMPLTPFMQQRGVLDIAVLTAALKELGASPQPKSNPHSWKVPMHRPHVLYPRYTRHGGVNSGTMPVYVPEVPFTQFPNLYLSNPSESMRSTEARFSGKCKLTGAPFEAGDTLYKVEGIGWCTAEGADQAERMGPEELEARMAQAQRNKHLSDSEMMAWESIGGTITSNGRPMMDRKFVSIKNAKAMLSEASSQASRRYGSSPFQRQGPVDFRAADIKRDKNGRAYVTMPNGMYRYISKMDIEEIMSRG